MPYLVCMYTIDTNILIYHANGDQKVGHFLAEQFEKNTRMLLPTIAVVEFFSFPRMNPRVQAAFEDLLPYFHILPLDYQLSLIAAQLRRSYRIKLGDSIIAATALTTGSTLITRNIRDFKKIPEIKTLIL